jgi:hypothetical protein
MCSNDTLSPKTPLPDVCITIPSPDDACPVNFKALYDYHVKSQENIQAMSREARENVQVIVT